MHAVKIDLREIFWDMLLLIGIVAAGCKIPRSKIRAAALRVLLTAVCASCPAIAQRQTYVGALGGIATLSSDGRSLVMPGSASTSSYKPENGGILNLFGGIHFIEYMSLQVNFTANRNDLTLTSITTPDAVYEQKRRSSQLAAAGDVLLYFRSRQSWARPFLSVGGGAARVKSELNAFTALRGSVSPPPNEFSGVKPELRVAVGIDISIGHGWAFRYSFLEAIQGNPISAQLAPAGQRNLASFQNLFGVFKSFGRTAH